MPDQTSKRYQQIVQGLRQGRIVPDASLPEVPETAPQEELGILEKWSPSVVRGIGGFIGSAPGIGALGGAGSELVAQGLENYFGTREDLSFPELAAAGALGFVGGGMVNAIGKSARPLVAAARGGALGASAPVIHDLITEGEIASPGDIATSGAIGAITAGGLNRLLGGMKKPKVEPPPTPLGQSRLTSEGKTVASKEVPLMPSPPVQGEATPSNISLAATSAAEKGGNKLKGDIRTSDQAAGRRFKESERTAAQAAKAAALAEKEALAAEEIAAARGEGLVPKESVSETFASPIPGGTARLSRRYVQPPEEEADDVLGNLPISQSAPVAPKPVSQAPAPQMPNLAGVLGASLGAREMPITSAAMPDLVGGGFPRGGTSQVAAQDPQDLIGALQGLANKRQAPASQVIERRGAPAQVIEDLPADITQRPGFDPNAGVVGGGGQLAKMTEAAAGDDRYGALRRQLGTEDLTLEQERARFPSAFGTGKDAPATPVEDFSLEGPDFSGMGQELTTIPTDLLRRSPGDISGEHYRNLKALLAGGEAMPKEAPRVAGRALKRIGDEEGGLATGRQAAAPQAPPPTDPTAGGAFGANASPELRDFFRRMSAEGRGRRTPLGPTGLGSRAGGESGFLNPTLAAQLGTGLFGAAVGGAMNQEDPMLGALLGGAAGAMLPSLASRVAAHIPDILNSPSVEDQTKTTLSSLGTPEGMKDAITTIVNRIPAALRFNLLASPNLFNNALVGPYGAALTAGLEHHLAGDPRGTELLRLAANPVKWAQMYSDSIGEASQRIGSLERSGGEMLGEATDPIGRVLSTPGTLMATGDVATRRLAMAAGFTEEEAMKFTLTSEPEWGVSKALANMPRSGILGSVIAPFVRTGVNAVEQSTFRAPGLGFLAQAARETPDTLPVQGVQQLMGTGAIGGGYLAGQNEDQIHDATGLPRNFLASLSRNVAGPYSALSSAGYAGGLAMDKTGDSQQALNKGGEAFITEGPLPTTRIPQSYWNFATREDHPLPQGVIPKGLADLFAPTERPGFNRPTRESARPRRTREGS